MGRKAEHDPGKTVTDPRQPGRAVPEHISKKEEDCDCVDQASEDSFPASDPPSFTPVSHTGKPRAPRKPA